MNRAVDVLASAVPDGAMLFQLAISGIVIGRDQANFFRDRFADEAVQRFSISMRNDTGHDIAVALDGTHNGFLAFAAGSRRALIPMPVPILAADESFINFDNAHELPKVRIGKSGTDAMTHIEGGRIGAEAHHAMNLQGGHALLAGQHLIDDFEPNPQRDICVFKDRADQDGKAISLRRTSWAFPFEGHSFQRIYAVASAVRATDTFWPAACNEIRFASGIVGEQFIKLSDSHLFGEFWGAHGSDLRV